MKKIFLLLSLSIAVTLACRLSSAVPLSTETTPTPSLHGDPLTPTPEVFNPLNPSPTPSGNELPLTCQVTDLNVSIDQNLGYCFAYPKRFTAGTQALFGIPAIQGPAITSSSEPIQASFAVEVSANDPNLSLDQQVDEFLKDFTVVDPASFEHARIIVGSEPAIMVDQIPVQLSWRIVFVQHAGNLYRLMYWPVDITEARADIDELYQTTIGSFAFLGLESTTAPATYAALHLSLDTGDIATGFQAETMPAVPANNDSPYWEILLEHARAILQSYPINNHSMKPQIFIYPVNDLGKFNESAGKEAADLQTLLQTQQSGEELPFLPLINAAQTLHSQVQYLDFKNGKGVRFLTQFNQGIVKINNNQLVYTFQGLTSDGKYYIAAVLPVTHSDLPATE